MTNTSNEHTIGLLANGNPYSAGDEVDQWLDQHSGEYVGRWVALDGANLIAVGDVGKAVFDKAIAAGVKCPFLLRITAKGLPSAGW